MIILLGGLVVSRDGIFIMCAFSVAQCTHILLSLLVPYQTSLRYLLLIELGVNAPGTLCSPTYYVLLPS
jgi:hypothetical protein